MILAAAATEIEMLPFKTIASRNKIACDTIITGVGPVAAAIEITRWLCEHSRPSLVLNFGVAGAYLGDALSRARLLDICLAHREWFGDLGICTDRGTVPLDTSIAGEIVCELDRGLRERVRKILKLRGHRFLEGDFVTVSGVSATNKRGKQLQGRFNGLCENMEGASVARACETFAVPVVEIRAVSNYVTDRDLSSWKLAEACSVIARVSAEIITDLNSDEEK